MTLHHAHTGLKSQSYHIINMNTLEKNLEELKSFVQIGDYSVRFEHNLNTLIRNYEDACQVVEKFKKDLETQTLTFVMGWSSKMFEASATIDFTIEILHLLKGDCSVDDLIKYQTNRLTTSVAYNSSTNSTTLNYMGELMDQARAVFLNNIT